MALTIVKKALSGRFPEALSVAPRELLELLRQEVVPVLRDVREAFNRFASGPYDYGTIMSGNGVPTLAPSGARAIYIRLDGGALTTLYVWNGVAWEAK